MYTDSWYKFNTAEIEGVKGIKTCAKNLFEEFKDHPQRSLISLCALTTKVGTGMKEIISN